MESDPTVDVHYATLQPIPPANVLGELLQVYPEEGSGDDFASTHPVSGGVKYIIRKLGGASDL
jgi:hypothetical protein